MTVILRELCPRDYYWFATLENDFPDISPSLNGLLTLLLLLDGHEEDFNAIPKSVVNVISWWIGPNLMQEKIMKLDQWFETAFHLCKQRFDVSMDWMEEQPVPKILLMIRTLTKHAKEQEREMRKARRK